MAAPQRKYDALVEQLEREGTRFGFFQAVQLLHRLLPGTTPVGELGPPHQEPVRFRHDAQLVFHAADIAAVAVARARDGSLRAEMTTTFLGLVGATSPLATVFSEELLHADGQEQASLRAFYDLFHHRLVSLFYRAWKKYRFEVGFRRDGSDAFSRRMLAFVGVDLAGAAPKRGLPPFELLSLAPLVSMRTRSARVLQIVLERLLGVERVTVTPFSLRRVTIREDERCLLARQNNVLGSTFAVGRTVPDRSGRFRVTVGPVPYATFEALMPGGAMHARVRDVITQFAPAHLEPELELVLDREHMPRFQLCAERGARLGVTTHLPMRQSASMRARVVLGENAGDAVPRLLSEEDAEEDALA
jgi:type VI secretion system protein ImpH